MGQDGTETQDITQEELDEIERLNETGKLAWMHDADSANLARTLLPRLARAYRKACEERDSGILTADLVAEAVAKAESEAYTRGRREAIEEAARHIRKGSEAARTIPGPGGEMVADALERAAKAIEAHESELSK